MHHRQIELAISRSKLYYSIRPLSKTIPPKWSQFETWNQTQPQKEEQNNYPWERRACWWPEARERRRPREWRSSCRARRGLVSKGPSPLFRSVLLAGWRAFVSPIYRPRVKVEDEDEEIVWGLRRRQEQRSRSRKLAFVRNWTQTR